MSATINATALESVSSAKLPQADPCVLVIFGARGDLTRRMLMPALFNLACIGCMTSNRFTVVGTGRKPLSDEQFREEMRSAVATSADTANFSDERWAAFAQRLRYVDGDLDDAAFYRDLGAHLATMQQEPGGANRLFYLSTPASLAAPIVQGLGAAGLAKNEKGWTRIVLEKPFGRDLGSARELNRIVASVFEEKDVYRIDHYLGKETVQNLLVFRFGNSIFEPVWNRNYVDYVEITAAETLGIGTRGAFYEETGALRDMVANHLLQLLTLTAMEPPISFDADSVREPKVQVLRSIHPMTPELVATRTVRGQYGPGAIQGAQVPGYRTESGVNPNSMTETYAALEFYVDNWRWAGVPFFVRTGKRLARTTTEVVVHFKRTPQALFARTPDENVEANNIIVRIQPNEGIAFAFGAKRPGSQMEMISVQADFSYQKAFGTKSPPAYETLLLDAMRGDATLFTRADEVEAEWRIITPIEESWAAMPPPPFPNYAAGSDGPEEANTLMPGESRLWRPLAEPPQIKPAADSPETAR
ncbi:MAG: glucose-6-phosphate dehydrogenase [Terriglobales bacterium]|jgi:glucose-6-phosphate 1-dehydrogenase